MPSPLQILRERTAAAHRQLELAHLHNGAATRAGYVALLRGSLAAVHAIEPVVTRWLPAAAQPSRVASLRRDLAELGERDDVEPIAVQLADDPATAWGAAYVVEGSTLGGVVLAQQFERALAPAERGATSYLRLRGAGTAAHWRAFVQALEQAPLDGDALERAVRAAVLSFGAYHRAFVHHQVIAA